MVTLKALVRRLPGLRSLARLVDRASRRMRSVARFRRDYREFVALAGNSKRRFRMRWNERYPCLDDRTQVVPFSHHYFYHLAWAAQVLSRTQPARHVDISSHVYFAGIMSAFMPFEYCEFRDTKIELENLDCRVTDLERLPFEESSVPSLSCMHVVEHVGLGRYGDRLDPEGDIAAMRELERVVAVGGDLLFVVPVGVPRIEYNAHRVYSYEQVIDGFPGMRLQRFALIPDRLSDGGLVFDASPELVAEQRFGCGCFWFVKEPASLGGGA